MARWTVAVVALIVSGNSGWTTGASLKSFFFFTFFCFIRVAVFSPCLSLGASPYLTLFPSNWGRRPRRALYWLTQIVRSLFSFNRLHVRGKVESHPRDETLYAENVGGYRAPHTPARGICRVGPSSSCFFSYFCFSIFF
jgi:hypothetical protein